LKKNFLAYSLPLFFFFFFPSLSEVSSTFFPLSSPRPREVGERKRCGALPSFPPSLSPLLSVFPLSFLLLSPRIGIKNTAVFFPPFPPLPFLLSEVSFSLSPFPPHFLRQLGTRRGLRHLFSLFPFFPPLSPPFFPSQFLSFLLSYVFPFSP